MEGQDFRFFNREELKDLKIPDFFLPLVLNDAVWSYEFKAINRVAL